MRLYLKPAGRVWVQDMTGDYSLKDTVILTATTSILVLRYHDPLVFSPPTSSPLRFLVLNTLTGEVVNQFDVTFAGNTLESAESNAGFYRLDDTTAAMCLQVGGGVAIVGTVSTDGTITQHLLADYPIGTAVHYKASGSWVWFDPVAAQFTLMYWTEYQSAGVVPPHTAPYYTAYGFTVDLAGTVIDSWPITVNMGHNTWSNYPPFYGTLMLPRGLLGGGIGAVIDPDGSSFTLRDNHGIAHRQSPVYPGGNYGGDAVIYQVDLTNTIAVIWTAYVPIPGATSYPYDEAHIYAQYFSLDPFGPLGPVVDLGRNRGTGYDSTLDERLSIPPIDVSRQFTAIARILSAASFSGYGAFNDPAGPASSVVGAIQNAKPRGKGKVIKVNVDLGVGSYRYQRITPAVASLGDLVLFAGLAMDDLVDVVRNYAQLYRIVPGVLRIGPVEQKPVLFDNEY
jgi:hypothetical protein